MKKLIREYVAFIENISTELLKVGIHRSELAMMDHICYRVATNERYQTL